ncbi:MAG: hypothetical protein Q9225_003022 [Loekoesia sp. 1 TL-2023]
MVEDEFLATAQLFTSHLHHAEYVRLKNAAKARNSALNTTVRPTDSITAMRAETIKKKQAEARAGRNKLALEQMKESARGKITESDHSDDFSEESDADKAPWAGTSLQGLMAPDARKQNLTSLSGLHGIKSSTRAAKGYSKPDDSQQSPSQRTASPKARLNMSKPSVQVQASEYPRHHTTNASKSKGRSPSKRLSDISSTSSSSSDDLDAPTTRPPPPKINNPHISLSKHKPPTTTHFDPLTLAAEDLFQNTQTSPHKTQPSKPARRSPPPSRSNHDLPDSSPPPRSEETAAAVRQRIQARRERAAAMEAKRKVEDAGGGGNVNVNEIPVFLV